jgi:hypothetical protein
VGWEATPPRPLFGQGLARPFAGARAVFCSGGVPEPDVGAREGKWRRQSNLKHLPNLTFIFIFLIRLAHLDSQAGWRIMFVQRL